MLSSESLAPPDMHRLNQAFVNTLFPPGNLPRLRCFRPFSLRRSFVALSTRPLVRAPLMVIAIARILFLVNKMPLKNFSERSEPRESNGRHGRSRDSGFE
jgi:hypothetical protein